MNRTLIRALLAIALVAGLKAEAQKFAFVDTKYILEQMPDYTSAQQELDHQSSLWQKEVDDRWDQIKRMRDAYNAEAVLLTEEMKKSRQDEIAKKETEARELQKKRFGVKGDLFKKREELIRPIQDRIFQAVQEVAGTSYLAVFDIGGVNNNVLYANPKFDKSDAVLKKLGIKPSRGGANAGNVRGDEDDQQQQNDREQDQDGGGKDGGGTNDKPKTDGGQQRPMPQNPKQ